ncbi:MAG TPA: hypothetical protein VIC28_07640 [Thermoanaerobaculia bacterium]|jgi:hypothetical protein
MATLSRTDLDLALPERLPFLESLSWFDRNYRDLPLLDILRRYESGWRWLGLLAEPTPEEWDFIRALVVRSGSVLDV